MILWLGIQLALSIFIVGIAITGVVAFWKDILG